MNSVNLIGRLTRDPEIRRSGDLPVASYTLAVDRAKDQTDFIRCVAFGKPAQFAEQYLHKGIKIAVSGRIQTGRYEKPDGETIYTTDVVVAAQEFCEKREQTAPTPTQAYQAMPGGQAIPVDEIQRQQVQAMPAQPVQEMPAQAGFVPAQNVAPMQGMPVYPGEY